MASCVPVKRPGGRCFDVGVCWRDRSGLRIEVLLDLPRAQIRDLAARVVGLERVRGRE